MKKVFIAVLALFMTLGTAYAGEVEKHKGERFGATFSSGGNIGLVYYGKDFGWAAGGKLGFKESDSEIEDLNMSWDTSSQEFSVFARKNFQLKDEMYLGVGAIASWASWDESVVVGNDGVEGELAIFNTEAESFAIAPYFIVDYHLNDNFIIKAGAKIVEFEFIEYEWGGNDDALTTDSVTYFDPFVGVTYLF